MTEAAATVFSRLKDVLITIFWKFIKMVKHKFLISHNAHNLEPSLYKTLNSIAIRRRIVLTETPLQNCANILLINIRWSSHLIQDSGALNKTQAL